METRTVAEVIGEMRTDRAFCLALEADPWLALACHDLILRPAPTAQVEPAGHRLAVRPAPIGRGQWGHRSPGHRQAA